MGRNGASTCTIESDAFARLAVLIAVTNALPDALEKSDAKRMRRMMATLQRSLVQSTGRNGDGFPAMLTAFPLQLAAAEGSKCSSRFCVPWIFQAHRSTRFNTRLRWHGCTTR